MEQCEYSKDSDALKAEQYEIPISGDFLKSKGFPYFKGS